MEFTLLDVTFEATINKDHRMITQEDTSKKSTDIPVLKNWADELNDSFNLTDINEKPPAPITRIEETPPQEPEKEKLVPVEKQIKVVSDSERSIHLSEKEKYLQYVPTIDKAYAIDSVTHRPIELADVSVVDIGYTGDFYVHAAIKGSGFVISEGQTGSLIASGFSRDEAIKNAKHKVLMFIKKSGEDAFYKLMNSQRDKLTYPNPRYLPQEEEEDVAFIPEVNIEHVIDEQPVLVVKPDISKKITLAEAVDYSINYLSTVDLEYISELVSEDVGLIKDKILEEKLAFENPKTEQLESSFEYLSGNVKHKLKTAKAAALIDSKFENNVRKLEEVIPKDIPTELIQYSLGAAWTPLEIFESFILSIFKTKVNIQYSERNGKFFAKTFIRYLNTQITNTYAAGGRNGIEILNAILNSQQVIATKSEYVEGVYKQVKDPDATAAIQEMQEQIQDEFVAYIRSNRALAESTEKIYNDVFNSYVHRQFIVPSIRTYPGAIDAPGFILRDHQKRAVLRGITESTLFAHEVGTGKSLILITTAMELRRLKKANKPMIVVQNKTRGQFLKTFRTLYPNANILAPTESELSSAGRAYFYTRIAEEDFDAVVIPQSQLSMIPDDVDRQRARINEQLDQVNELFLQTNKKNMPFEYAQLKREIKSLQKELSEIDIDEEKRKSLASKTAELFGSPEVLNFEQMGVDALLIDEFHFFKRLGFATSMINIKGIDTSKSKRSQSALLKIRWIQENNQGRNVLVYTGTPISNTMAEAWTMIRYVRPDILDNMGISHFDQFAKTFGQVIPSLEQTGGGTFKIQNRFAKFQNLPEFISAFRMATDVVLLEDIPDLKDKLPKLFGGGIQQRVLKQSPQLRDQIAEFRKTLEWFEALEGSEKRQFCYIPMVIFTRAKQASIDLRLLNPTNPDIHNSKVNAVIKDALKTYFETDKTQMIFCDMYQSPDSQAEFLDEDNTIVNPAFNIPRFNLFNDIRDKLIANGVPAKQIALLTESKWNNPEKLEQLFEDANNGYIKFMLGSTERMGVGVNAQEDLIGLSHIDAPARPMDFTQRNGRAERQGNLNEFIHIRTYGVERTLDSAAFQRLATKQRFINQIMKGDNLERVTDDAADESQMTFDEMMAQLSDSPYAMQKLLVDNRLKAERTKRDNFNAKLIHTHRQLNYNLEDIKKYEIYLAESNKYSEIVSQYFPTRLITNMNLRGQVITGEDELLEALTEVIDLLIDKYNESPSLSSRGTVIINGVRVQLVVKNVEKMSPKTKMMYNTPHLSFNSPDIGIFENTFGNGKSVSRNSAVNLIASIEYEVQEILSKGIYEQNKINRCKEANQELQQTLDSVFDETRLHELEAESDNLKQKMLEESLKPVVDTEDEELEMINI